MADGTGDSSPSGGAGGDSGRHNEGGLFTSKKADSPSSGSSGRVSVTFAGVLSGSGKGTRPPPPAFTQRSLPPRKKSFVDRTAKWDASVTSKEERGGHMDKLLKDKRKSMKVLFPLDSQLESFKEDDEDEEEETDDDVEKNVPVDLNSSVVLNREKMSYEVQSEFVRNLQEVMGKIGGVEAVSPVPPLEIRVQKFSFKVPSRANGPGKDDISTVATPLFKIRSMLIKYLQYHKQEKKEKLVTSVLSNVNLVLKPKKMYLVLGPPQSGKTSLLKAIGGSLPQGNFPSGFSEKKHLTGQVLYNNLVCCGEGADTSKENFFKNLVSFVSQHDTHAPRLTVGETFVFSGSCKDESIRKNRKGTSENGKVGLTLQGLGLSHVKDTFVGNEQIRGVSGGQRRRVTLGEMIVFDTPLLW